MRFVLAGSIGLDTVAARLRLGDAINDLHIEGLGAFSPETADRFLAALADSYRLALDEAHRAAIVNRVGWPIPFFLQLAFSRLRALCGDRGCAPSHDLVREAYEDMLSVSQRGHFDWWRQRLHEELGRPDAGWAHALLSAVTRDRDGLTRDTLRQLLVTRIQDPDQREDKLMYLLKVLEGDGYLVRVDGRYAFRSPLLLDFWTRHVT